MTVKWRKDTKKWQAVINDKELFGNYRPAQSFEGTKEGKRAAQKWEQGQIASAKDGRYLPGSNLTFHEVATIPRTCLEQDQGAKS